MSSMRNAVQRRNHKERAQPEERKKLGLLEKHKDYSRRARDYNAKKATLASLRKKVLEKNPDEFYHGMLSRTGGNITVGNKGRSSGTVDGKREGQVLSVETVRLLKTQDGGYLRTVGNQVRKEVEGLEQSLKGFRGVGRGGKRVGGEGRRVVFCEDGEELERRLEELDERDLQSLADEDGDDSESGGEEEGEREEISAQERNIRNMQRKEQRKLENKLGVARERLKALMQAERELDLQRAKMGKSATIGGTAKNGKAFKIRARKR